MDQQQPKINEQRVEQLRALSGKEVFCIAFSLMGDGYIEVLNIVEVFYAPEDQPVPVKLAGRAWRQHHLGVDTFFSLSEAVKAVSVAREEEIKALQARIEALVAIQLKAPTDKVQEAQAQQDAALALQESLKQQAQSLVKKPAVKKPAAKKPAVKKISAKSK